MIQVHCYAEATRRAHEGLHLRLWPATVSFERALRELPENARIGPPIRVIYGATVSGGESPGGRDLRLLDILLDAVHAQPVFVPDASTGYGRILSGLGMTVQLQIFDLPAIEQLQLARDLGAAGCPLVMLEARIDRSAAVERPKAVVATAGAALEKRVITVVREAARQWSYLYFETMGPELLKRFEADVNYVMRGLFYEGEFSYKFPRESFRVTGHAIHPAHGLQGAEWRAEIDYLQSDGTRHAVAVAIPVA
jgi:hypothetical protein